MSISLNRRSGVLVSTASIPGSFGESSSGIARPLRIGLHRVAGRVVAREGDLNCARAAVVGHAETADLGDLRLREADRREDRLLLRTHDRYGGVGGGLLARELEDAYDVRVIRCLDGGRVCRRSRDGCGDPRGERLVERIVQRLRELGQAMVVALEHRRDDLLVMAEQAA